ncbi:MAG: L,D-transpeptidase family protein [Chitinophagaceae bacterium]
MLYRLLVFYVVFFFVGNENLMAQRRQSDSMRAKQEAYNKQLAEEKNKQIREQQQAAMAKKNAAVVSYDSYGNKIETGKSKTGEMVVTKSIVIPSSLNRPFSLDTIQKEAISIKVVKSKYRVYVYHGRNLLTSYKCVFGPNCTKQKLMEGDRCTPEGTFTISLSREHEKWEKFMLIDYPNEESRRLHEQAKNTGFIPKDARIGGAVGIHGIWKNGDNVIDLKHNWTDGCVSLKNKDVEELATLIVPGSTRITIER